MVPLFNINAKTMPPSVLRIPKTFRKTPTGRRPNENETFRKTDEIKCFADITENYPAGYKFQIHEEKVTFCEVDEHA